MNDHLYSQDPAHPDAHPIYDGRAVQRIFYDPATLRPGQRKWEARRNKLREEARKRRLVREEEESRNPLLKEHRTYVPAYAGITPHDFDGSIDHCKECDAPLWGTEYVMPLWQKTNPTSRLLKAPACFGCCRLYEKTKDETEKYKVILWMLTGFAENLKNDKDIEEFSGSSRASTMRLRAKQMRSNQLYDHPDWRFLKSKKELIYEYSQQTGSQISSSALERIIREDRNIVPVFFNTEVEVATSQQIEKLVISRGARDALLGHRCYLGRGSHFNSLTLDHIEPVSHVRFVDGSYSIGNLQILSFALNQVKGNYNERELCRWLGQILKRYEYKYGNPDGIQP